MTYRDETLPIPDSREDAGKLLAEFAFPQVAGNEQQAVDQVVMAAQRLNMPDEHLNRLRQAVAKAALNATDYSREHGAQAPLVIRVLLLGQAQQVKPSSSLGWGFFVLERITQQSGQVYRAIDLFLYQEGSEREHDQD